MTDLIGNTNTFGIWALASAAVASASLRRSSWLILAALLAAMAIVIATNVHWIIHDRIRAILITDGIYADHARIQMAITLVGALGAACAGLWIVRAGRGVQRGAWLTTLALIGLFCIQTLSVHGVDALLSMRLGPMMLIGWLWGMAALMILLAVAHAHQKGG